MQKSLPLFKVPLEIIEMQSGAYLGEDDIVRLMTVTVAPHDGGYCALLPHDKMNRTVFV